MKNLDKIYDAINLKYELYDINHARLVPKEIVCCRHLTKLDIGIIIKINPKSTTIYTLEEEQINSRPNEQMIITSLIDNKEQYYQLYDKITKKRKQKSFLRYFVCLVYDKSKINQIGEFGYLIVKYYLYDKGTNSTSSWNNFLENFKFHYEDKFKNCELLAFGTDDLFHPLYETNYKDINYISNTTKGYIFQLYYTDNELFKNEYIYFPMNKELSILYKNYQLPNGWGYLNDEKNYIEDYIYYNADNRRNTIFCKNYNSILNKDLFKKGINEFINNNNLNKAYIN